MPISATVSERVMKLLALSGSTTAVAYAKLQSNFTASPPNHDQFYFVLQLFDPSQSEGNFTVKENFRPSEIFRPRDI